MKNLDLGKSNTNKIFWAYVIPAVLSMIFHTTAQFVDSAFIGNYVGENGLSAITMLFPFMMLLNGVSIMIAIGGVTYAGISRGKENDKLANNFFNLTLVLIVFAGLVSTLLFLGMNNYFGVILNVSGETLVYIKQYGFYIGIFFIFNMLNLTFNLFLNLDKRPILVVVISSLSTALNVLLNYIFIVQMNMGLVGAALASGISQFIPTIIFGIVIIKKSTWKIFWPQIRFGDIKKILFNGSSELVNISSVAISSFIINRIILEVVGLGGVASYSIAMQLAGLMISFGFGVSDAIQSPLSFNFGAKEFGRVKKVLFKALRFNVIIGVIFMFLSYFFGDVFAGFLVKDIETIEYSHHILRYYSVAFLVMGANVIITTYYTSMDSPIISGVLSLLNSLVFLGIWLLILPNIFGEDGIWLTLVFAPFSTSFSAFIIYLKYPFGDKVKKTDFGYQLISVTN